MNRRTAEKDPDPIEADFEPAQDAGVRSARSFGAKSLRGRPATLTDLVIAAIVAVAVATAAATFAAGGGGAGAATATLAHEIDLLTGAQENTNARVDAVAADIVALRAAGDAAADRMNRQDAAAVSLRAEVAALAGQLSAIAGMGDPGAGASPAALSAGGTPLGQLLSRLAAVENALSADQAAPQTTTQMQRALAALTDQVGALSQADDALAEALDRRQAALAALEDGLDTIAADVDILAADAAVARNLGVKLGVLRPAASAPSSRTGGVLAATQQSRAIRALSSLESAAREGRPFVGQQQELAELLPDDASVAALAIVAPSGVANLAQLRADFDSAARIARRSPSGETAESKLQGARQALVAGDIKSALSAVAALPDPAAAPFAAWRDRALRRSQVDEHLTDISRRVLGPAAQDSSEG